MRFERLASAELVQNLIDFHNSNSSYVVLDTETTSVNPREAKLIDIQLSGRDEDHAVIFSGEYRHLLRRLVPKVVLVAHNYKYDAHVLFLHGVDLLDRVWRDTILLGHLVNENRESYSLASYVEEISNDSYKDFWEKYEAYEDASEEDKIEYGCRDVYYTRRVFISLSAAIDGDGIPSRLVEHVHRLQTSLLKTEIEGLKVDTDYLVSLGTRLKLRINEIEPEMRKLVRHQIGLWELQAYQKELDLRSSERGKAGVKWPEFNFASSTQLKWLLYTALGLPPQKNEKTKQISTDYDALEKIKEKHPVVALLQEYRDLCKVYTAFVEGTNERISGGRIYPEFRVNGTKTGRISAANPNLQQLPRSGGVRGIYIPNPGNVLISADYSSLEVYLAANFTKDEGLLKVVLGGLSLHDVTAQGVGIERQLAKTLNFAEGYGCSHFKVAKILGVSESKGMEVHKRYWQTYAGQKKKMDECNRFVDEGKPIVTPWGRRRRFEHIKRSPWDKAYRQAWNFLPQSTGADCTNRAYYLFDEHLRRTGRGRAWFPLHDEVIAEVKPEFAEEELKHLCEIMTKVGNEIGLDIPLKAEPSGPSQRWED